MRIVKSFEKWKTQEVEETFGIKQTDSLQGLDALLQADFEISEQEQAQIENLRTFFC